MKSFFQRPFRLIFKDILVSCIIVSLIICLDRIALLYFGEKPVVTVQPLPTSTLFVETQAPTPIVSVQSLYVSQNGSSNSICSQETPCSSYTQAELLAQPGTTIYLSGALGIVHIQKSGTEGEPINIIGEDDVLLNGVIVDGNYVNLYNLEVADSVSHGIIVNSKNVLVENAVIYNSVTENGSDSQCDGTSWGSALKARVGAENLILRGNTIYHNCGEGIAITRAINVLLENNIVGSNYSVGIYVDNSYNVIAKNNTVTCDDTYLRDGRRMSGMVFASEEYEGWGMQLHDNSFLNNTVTGCFDNFASWMSEDETPSINLTIDGNTSIDSVRRSINISSFNENVVISNNILDRPVYIDEDIDTTGLILIDNQVVNP